MPLPDRPGLYKAPIPSGRRHGNSARRRWRRSRPAGRRPGESSPRWFRVRCRRRSCASRSHAPGPRRVPRASAMPRRFRTARAAERRDARGRWGEFFSTATQSCRMTAAASSNSVSQFGSARAICCRVPPDPQQVRPVVRAVSRRRCPARPEAALAKAFLVAESIADPDRGVRSPSLAEPCAA